MCVPDCSLHSGVRPRPRWLHRDTSSPSLAPLFTPKIKPKHDVNKNRVPTSIFYWFCCTHTKITHTPIPGHPYHTLIERLNVWVYVYNIPILSVLLSIVLSSVQEYSSVCSLFIVALLKKSSAKRVKKCNSPSYYLSLFSFPRKTNPIR